MKRILSIDGGGIRGVFAIAVLERIEAILRERFREERPDFVLADYFDFIGGTSTGAVIAALLSRGNSVRAIREHYERLGPMVFRRKPLWQSWRSFYGSAEFAAFLRELFTGPDGTLMTLGSDQLRTALMLVMRNGTTGSTWPITNCPEARYNRRGSGGRQSNLDLPLWQLIRASAAAPSFFPSERISLPCGDGRTMDFEFVDGGVSAYNNPALAMFLAATLPAYAMNYPKGADRLFLCSVGTGSLLDRYAPGELGRINVLGGALRTLRGLMETVSEEQDKLCRLLGTCIHGAPIDREFGDFIRAGRGDFLYCRYQHQYTEEEKRRCREETGTWKPFGLDDLASIPHLRQVGERYAAETVAEAHFP